MAESTHSLLGLPVDPEHGDTPPEVGHVYRLSEPQCFASPAGYAYTVPDGELCIVDSVQDSTATVSAYYVSPHTFDVEWYELEPLPQDSEDVADWLDLVYLPILQPLEEEEKKESAPAPTPGKGKRTSAYRFTVESADDPRILELKADAKKENASRSQEWIESGWGKYRPRVRVSVKPRLGRGRRGEVPEEAYRSYMGFGSLPMEFGSRFDVYWHEVKYWRRELRSRSAPPQVRDPDLSREQWRDRAEHLEEVLLRIRREIDEALLMVRR